MKQEEYLRNKLKNHKVDWDKEELLGNLKQELNHDERKIDRRWFLFFPVILLLLALWYFNSDSDTNSVNSFSSVTQETSVSQINNESIKTKQTIQTKPVKQAKLNPLSKTINTSKENQPNSLNKQNQPNNTYRTNSSNPTNQVNKSYLAKNVNKPNEATTPSVTNNFINPSQITKTIKVKEVDLANNTNSVDKPNKANGNNIASLNNSANQANGLNNFKSNLRNQLAHQNTIPSKATNAISQNLVLGLDLIAQLAFAEIDWIKRKLNIPSSVIIDPINKESRLQKPFYFSVSGDIGWAHRSRSFGDTSENLYEQLKANANRETPLYIARTQFNLGYQHSSGWSLQSGIDYQEIKEVFKFKEETVERMIKDTIAYFIVDTNRDTTFFNDSILVNRTTTWNVRHFNTHKFVSIPIQLGYQFQMKKATFVTRLGVSYTFAHSYKGRFNYIFSDGSNQVIFNNMELDYALKDRIGLQLALALEYPVMNYHQFFIQSSFRRSPSMTLGDSQQQYHSISLGAGFKYNLGRRD